MISIEIKNTGKFELHNLLLDLNGTICCDGNIICGVCERIQKLKEHLKIFLISADTLGNASKIADDLGITLVKLNQLTSECDQKAAFLESIDPSITVAIGNGQNDTKMLKLAKIGFGIMGPEGIVPNIFSCAKIIVTSPVDALDLLLLPNRLIATLRD